MKIQAVIPKKNRVSQSFRFPIREKRKLRLPMQTTICVAAAAIGLASGVVLFYLRQNEISDFLRIRFDRFNTGIQTLHLQDLLFSCLRRDLLLLLCSVLPGVGLTGCVTLPILYTSFCSGISVLACYLVRRFTMQGLGFFFLCLFPGRLVQMFALLLLTLCGFEMSTLLIRAARGESPLLERMFVKYMQRTMLGAFLLFVASFIDSILIVSFKSLFFLS